MIIDLSLPESGQHRVTIIRRLDSQRSVVSVFLTDVYDESEIEDPKKMLMDCGRMNHGAFAIWHNRLVVLDTQVEETADIEEVAAIIYHLANYAARMRQMKSLSEGKPPASIGKVLGGPRQKKDE
jgi:hypothetical protein